MNEQDLAFLVKFITMGAKVLSARIATFVTLLITAGIFAWAMYAPDPYRATCAAGFALLVLWPILRLDKEAQREKAES